MANTRAVYEALPIFKRVLEYLRYEFFNVPFVDIEGAMQEVLKNFWKQEPTGVKDPKGYFVESCRNKVKDFLRKEHADLWGEFDERRARKAYRTPIEEAFSKEVIRRLLVKLTDGQREVVGLRLEGYSDVEIARKLGVSGSAIRMRMQDARSRLKKKAA